MFRFVGAGAILLVVASTVSAAAHYTETWNPPEARGQAYGKAAHGQWEPRQRARLAVKSRRLPSIASVAKLPVKLHSAPQSSRAKAPDVSDIPRQITPEGNVLRVDSRHAPVQVTR